MFDRLSFENFKQLAKSASRIAVYKEIAGDRLTPTNVLLALQKKAKNITLLETSTKELKLGRYSHLCFDPHITIKAYGRNIFIESENNKKELCADPFEILREYQSKYKVSVVHPLSGFAGGMIGFLSYDAIRLIEDIPDSNQDIDQIPDILFRFYKHHITFDHQTDKVVISAIVDATKNSYEKAQIAIEQIEKIVFNFVTQNTSSQKNIEYTIKVDIDDQVFRQMVDKAKAYIKDGDIFQAVLSRRFSVDVSATPFEVYRALRFSNPSPYMFYIELDDCVITGASPEKLVSIENNVIESCPLAGTRVRGSLPDVTVASHLLADQKEVAEHMMLVDLSRNDLGKVSVPGSVKVHKLKEIEYYSHVMHISSSVTGKLREDKDVFDVIKATIPAGTLSGAPKIKAMSIIDELETSRRGIYGGVICAIDANSNLESCIVIRTAIIKDGVATVRAGAGVVYDSEAQREADETYHKAKAILDGILLAQAQIL